MEWEYAVQKVDMSGLFAQGAFDPNEVGKMLNWYGGQGWELASTFPTASGHGGTMSVGFVFKRPKVVAPPVQPRGQEDPV
jgi:hypothetical protein